MLGNVMIQKLDAQNKLSDEPWKYALRLDDQQFLDQLILQDLDVAMRVRFLEIKVMISNGQNNAVFFGDAHDINEGRAARALLWQWNTLAGKPMHLSENDNVIVTGMGLATTVRFISSKLIFAVRI